VILSKVFILTRLLPTNVCKYQDKAKGNDSYFAEEFIIYMEGIKEGSASKRRSTPFLHYSNL